MFSFTEFQFVEYTYIVFLKWYQLRVKCIRKIVRNNRIHGLDEWFYDRIHRDLHHNNRIKRFAE